MKLIALFLACFAFSCANSLKVDIYYEALCPDSIAFITQQFYPAWQKLAPYLEWQFVPYGFASKGKRHGSWHFTCQHGPKECFSNKAQGCAIKYAKNVVQQVEFVNCVESNVDPGVNATMYQCAQKVGIDFEKIKTCLIDGTADDIFAANGVKTEKVTPKIKFIPTIIFNEVYDEKLQNQAITDFFKAACTLLKNEPKACTASNTV